MFPVLRTCLAIMTFAGVFTSFTATVPLLLANEQGGASIAERGAESTAAVDFSPVEKLLKEHVERNQIAGAVAMVQTFGHRPALYEVHVGMRDVRAGLPMTDDTLFRIASMTKPITSAAVLKLVEEGKLALDERLDSILPEFANIQVEADEEGKRPPVAAVRAITIHDLLTHTSGLAYGMSSMAGRENSLIKAGVCDGLVESDLSLEENVRRIAKATLAKQPGSAWQYGLSTDVLGRVIEVRSGMRFEEYLRQTLFEPLGMRDTSFEVSNENLPKLAKLYRSDKEHRIVEVPPGPRKQGSASYSSSYQHPGATRYRSGGAGLVSTAGDYMKFLAMLIQGGAAGETRILRPETVRMMTKNQIGDLHIEFTIHGDKFGYGFGIHQDSRERNGSAPGAYSWAGMFHSYFWVDPERQVTAVLMTQLYPAEDIQLWQAFQKTVNKALDKSSKDYSSRDGATKDLPVLVGD